MTKADSLLIIWAILFLFRSLVSVYHWFDMGIVNLVSVIAAGILLILMIKQGLFKGGMPTSKWVWIVTSIIIVASILISNFLKP